MSREIVYTGSDIFGHFSHIKIYIFNRHSVSAAAAAPFSVLMPTAKMPNRFNNKDKNKASIRKLIKKRMSEKCEL